MVPFFGVTFKTLLSGGRDFFSVEELLFLLIAEGDSARAQQNLQSYITALECAGYLGRKLHGSQRRYRLRRDMDTGPLAPAWNKATRMVTDANTDKRFHVPATVRGAA